MAALRINKGSIDGEHDTLDEVPEADWDALLRARRRFVQVHIPHDCRKLLEFVADAERMHGPLGFADIEDFIRRGLEIDPTLADWAVRGLRSLDPGEAIPLDEAVKRGRALAKTMATAEKTKPQTIGKGAPGPGRAKKTDDQVNRLSDSQSQSKGGNRAEYLAGRIKARAETDPKAAEVVRRVERGEYSSMRAAARDAGVLKPVDPVRAAINAVAKVPVDRLGELVEVAQRILAQVGAP